jgi:hypothetical protein
MRRNLALAFLLVTFISLALSVSLTAAAESDVTSLVPQLAAAPRNAWITTWAASPQSADPDPNEPLLRIEDQTVGERVRISIGGAQIRIRLSNEHGSAPLLIGAATVATPNDSASVRPGSIHIDGPSSI